MAAPGWPGIMRTVIGTGRRASVGAGMPPAVAL